MTRWSLESCVLERRDGFDVSDPMCGRGAHTRHESHRPHGTSLPRAARVDQAQRRGCGSALDRPRQVPRICRRVLGKPGRGASSPRRGRDARRRQLSPDPTAGSWEADRICQCLAEDRNAGSKSPVSTTNPSADQSGKARPNTYGTSAQKPSAWNIHGTQWVMGQWLIVTARGSNPHVCPGCKTSHTCLAAAANPNNPLKTPKAAVPRPVRGILPIRAADVANANARSPRKPMRCKMHSGHGGLPRCWTQSAAARIPAAPSAATRVSQVARERRFGPLSEDVYVLFILQSS